MELGLTWAVNCRVKKWRATKPEAPRATRISSDWTRTTREKMRQGKRIGAYGRSSDFRLNR